MRGRVAFEDVQQSFTSTEYFVAAILTCLHFMYQSLCWSWHGDWKGLIRLEPIHGEGRISPPWRDGLWRRGSIAFGLDQVSGVGSRPRDVVLVIRNDEAGHRDVNHGFADELKRANTKER